MDTRDLQIISILQDDGKSTNLTIARSIDTSEETVRRRRETLLGSGDMRIVCIPDPSLLGYGTQALIGLSVDLASVDAVAAELAGIDEITWVSITTGLYDILIWVVTRSTATLKTLLGEQIGAVTGVLRSETFVCLENRKERHGVKV
ncbi:MAG: Lrp/AsnC family transcriptional regulator [SAR202 cluster bacterium]|jgi:Lrp/AsnC family transcriptional regulator for asnA, asnC and gidA|nr:Lrp/AsnC family transcriptional regulator [SAR202 cluster bacterium]